MKRELKFYCFSPPVMVATFIIEFSLLIYTVVRYKLNTLTRLAAATLFFLGLFQVAEYNVCGGYGVSAASWSRVGYVAITMLPPLGVHLAYVIAKRRQRLLVSFAYLTGIVWAVIFGASTWAFAGHICAGNYVVFQLRNNYGGWYFIYYYFWLFVVLGLCAHWYKQTKNRLQKESLYYLGLGYIVFILPTAIVNTISPSTMDGIPSIMCGFAVLFALILSFCIVPRTLVDKHK